MTFEANLSSIAKSLEIIAQALSAKSAPVATPAAAPVVVATPVVAPAIVAPTPVPTPAPTPMPALPVFTPAQPVTVATPVLTALAAASTSPVAPAFADKSAMMDYVLSSYKALGQEKGAKIQEVLNGMGVANINDVPAERWGELKVGIEALKG
jgi:hypothetical protein